ncbi:hypothetical protein A9C19_14205 [Bacillus weihaiensis]|uniref:Uncharacterized protein n=1 Tax=Bacillus weihaiensis TaxID=1547283 RepID=A0A1L3MTX4_9BACI|nr:hypothetical protein A9C19_14205 [Bacillus weihaiensis]
MLRQRYKDRTAFQQRRKSQWNTNEGMKTYISIIFAWEFNKKQQHSRRQPLKWTNYPFFTAFLVKDMMK